MAQVLASSLNFSTANKWVAVIPFQMIDPNYTSSNVQFNLTNFSLPEMTVSTSTTPFQGYEIEIPTNVRNQDKSITFEYMLSSDYHQYKVLYNWLEKIVKEEGTGTTNNMVEYTLPIHIIMLSEFKEPIFEIVYNGCWIKSLGALEFDYQDPEDTPIKHAFTCAYFNFEFNENPS